MLGVSSTSSGVLPNPGRSGASTFAFDPSDAIVLIDERDDSIDDGMFAIDMVGNLIPNVPAGYHGGSGGLTYVIHDDAHPLPPKGRKRNW